MSGDHQAHGTPGTAPSPNLGLRHRPNGRDVLLVFLGGVAAIVFLVAAAIAFNHLSDGALARHLLQAPGRAWGQILVASLVLFVPVYLVGIKARNLGWADLGFVKPSKSWVGLAVLLGFAAHIAVGILHFSLGEPLKGVMAETFDPGNSGIIDRMAVFLVVTAIVPLVEEVYFRAHLFRWIAIRWDPALGSVISAMAFGALHGHLVWAMATALLGLVLAYVYWRSGSLWTSIVLHGSFNGVGLTGILFGV